MRIRTGYSFKHAVGHVSEVIDRLAEMGWRDAPICDRSSTYGFVRWTKAAKDKGLRPVYGCELPVVKEFGEKKPIVDWWGFFARDRLRDLHEAVALSTKNGGLSYEQAQALPGLIRVTGERVILDRLRKKTKDLYVGLAPSTPVGLYREAERRGFRLLATNDNVYTRAGDAEFYRITLGFRASTQTYPQSILDDDELRAALRHVDDKAWRLAVKNRDAALRACSARLERAELLSPEKEKTLRELCLEGAARLGVDLKSNVYADRLEKELRLIAEKKFEDYFHIISDLMLWSRKRMMVGPARGSSCGSLVCYLLGITSVDPIPFDLVFERFIDTTRSDLPDIDLDFSDARRHLAIEYLVEKYGHEHSARLGSVNTHKSKNALNLIGVALRVPSWQINEIANTVVKRSQGDSRATSTVIDALEGTETGRKIIAEFPAAVIADRIESHPASAAQHAAGVILTEEPVLDYVAVDSRTGATMCDKKDAEEMNLLKIDMLGLTHLSVMERCMELIGKRPRVEFFEALPLDDQGAYDQLNRLRFSGVFQFTPSSAASNLVKRFVTDLGARLDNIEDIVSLTAIVRPGPLGSGMADQWLRRRAGAEQVTYEHPLLEPFLRNTYGLVVYQEQVMLIGRELGDLTWEDVTALRKAMSKSLGKEYFDQFGDRWKSGAVKRGMEPDAAEKFWDKMCQFGMWAFNRSHSVAYGLLSYWGLWLKAHHPVEYAAATLDAESRGVDAQERQVTALREMRDEGIDYVAVDPDRSTDRWTIAEKRGRKVLVGPLTNIRGIGPKTVRDILDARATGEEVRESVRKKIHVARTPIDSLSPVLDRVGVLCPNLEDVGIRTRPTPIGEVLTNGTQYSVLVIGKVAKIDPLNENEPARVAKRGGLVFSPPFMSVRFFLVDDSAEIFCKIGRFQYNNLNLAGAPIGPDTIAKTKVGKSIFAVKGIVPEDFRMIRVMAIKYLGEME